MRSHLKIKNTKEGWCYSSVVECLHGICEILMLNSWGKKILLRTLEEEKDISFRLGTPHEHGGFLEKQ